MTDPSDAAIFMEIRDVLDRANLGDLEMLDFCISMSAVFACALDMPRATVIEMLEARMVTAAALDPRDRAEN